MARTDHTSPDTGPTTRTPSGPSARGKALIVLVVVLVFVVLIGMRMGEGTQSAVPTDEAPTGDAPIAGVPDPVASLESALGAGRPVFVLFHSSSCAPCIEIAATAARVMPDYTGQVTFVDVYTDDPRARPLFSQFAFQYIPTSFFLAADGSVVEQHTGVLNDGEMRERLDTLVGTAAGS